MKPLSTPFGHAVDLIWPPNALDGGPAGGRGLSGAAWSGVSFLEAPVCDGCGLPFAFDPAPGGAAAARCAACTNRRRAFDRARAACLYDAASRELILQFKHGDRTDLSRLFALWLSRAAGELISDADLIVPVPIHPLRLLKRRYNQAAEIARPLARLSGRTYAPGLLVRRRRTDSQGGKSGSGRRRNVAGAFMTPDGAAAKLAGKSVLLVDDVLTTGATAEACAKALKAAGAARVDLAVIARVQASEPDPI